LTAGTAAGFITATRAGPFFERALRINKLGGSFHV
jgi:hypothetical protein